VNRSEWNLAGEFELDDGSKARLWFREDLNGRAEGAISIAHISSKTEDDPFVSFRRFEV
jgi:hypothetical protein